MTGRSHEVFETILNDSKNISSIVVAISESWAEEGDDMAIISRDVHEVYTATRERATASEETEASSEGLNVQAAFLEASREELGKFVGINTEKKQG